MPNKLYERGYRAELKAVRILQALSYWTERNHASKGTFDIVASNADETLFIQVKRTKTPITSIAAVYRVNKKDITRMQAVPHPETTRVELWVYVDPQPGSVTVTWHRYTITPSGLLKIPMLPLPTRRKPGRKPREATC
jgi:hypothetical protein